MPLKIALVCARGLGDALLSMIIAHNFRLSGIEITTFSSILCELKEWFPGFKILPYPEAEQYHTCFSRFDKILAADYSLIKESHNFGNEVKILKECKFDKNRTMVKNLQFACINSLSLPFSVPENGMVPPEGCTWKAYPQRVILHPMSADERKNWPMWKFIRLADNLKKHGFDPFFCVSPSERILLKDLVAEENLPLFPKVSDLAYFVYESGFLIGNDSGIGHLASSFHIPTLSLFARRSYAALWRPGWGPGAVVSPIGLLPGSRLRQKYWKSLLNVKRVEKAFMKLRKETLAHPFPFSKITPLVK